MEQLESEPRIENEAVSVPEEGNVDMADLRDTESPDLRGTAQHEQEEGGGSLGNG